MLGEFHTILKMQEFSPWCMVQKHCALLSACNIFRKEVGTAVLQKTLGKELP